MSALEPLELIERDLIVAVAAPKDSSVDDGEDVPSSDESVPPELAEEPFNAVPDRWRKNDPLGPVVPVRRAGLWGKKSAEKGK